MTNDELTEKAKIMSDDSNDPWKAGYNPRKGGNIAWKEGKEARRKEIARNKELAEKARARNDELDEKMRKERARNETAKNDALIKKARNPNIYGLAEKEQEVVMKFDWDNWNTGGRIIFVAACAATLSMFMNWVDVGITTRVGVSQQAIILLGFWVYPVMMLFKSKTISLIWGLLCATLSFIISALYIAMKSIEFLGETINVSAIGAWVFLLASFALGVGIIKHNSAGFSDAETNTFPRSLGIFSNVEIKTFPRPLGITFAILFGFIGSLLLAHWLFDPEGDVPNIVLIAWFIFTVISARLGLVFGLFGENALYANRSAIVLTAKWFLIVAFSTFVILLLGAQIIDEIGPWINTWIGTKGEDVKIEWIRPSP